MSSPVNNRLVIPSDRVTASPLSSTQSSNVLDQQARTERESSNYRKRYYQLHKAEIKVKQAAYHKLHKAEINARQVAYYKLQKTAIKIKRAAYRQLHREQIRAYDAGYGQAKKQGPEALKKFKKEWAERRKSQRDITSERRCEEDKAASTLSQSSLIPSPVKTSSIPKPPLLFPDLPQGEENHPWNTFPEQLIPQSGHWPEIDESLEKFFEKYFER